jgi:hypothetical protein
MMETKIMYTIWFKNLKGDRGLDRNKSKMELV